MNPKFCLSLASALLFGGIASAEEKCHTVEIPLQPTNWTSSLDVPRFDPLDGILLGISFELSGRTEGSAAIESLDAAASTVDTSFQATLTLSRPDTTVIVVTTPIAAFSDDLTSFDGSIDFGGSSGKTHGGIVATASETAVAPPPPSDLLLFTGAPGNPGTISLPIEARGNSSATGSGNLITQFQTSAAASLEVCYLYAPDCNQNGVPDSIDIDKGASNDGNTDGVPDECQPTTTSFCEGDGAENGGADCPCGNDGLAGEGCDNGTGTGGLLTASGTPSVSNDTLTLTASQIPGNAPGFFFYSGTTTNSGIGVPFGSGLRCLDVAVRVRKIDGGGTIPSGNMPALSIFLGIAPGETSYFQYWYRNPTGPCPGLSANSTNGVMVVWGL